MSAPLDPVEAAHSAALRRLHDAGLLFLGPGAVVEPGVELCHPTRSGELRPVRIGPGCHVRSGSVVYSGVELAEGSQTGHHVMIRENTSIGRHSVIGTAAVCEFGTRIGDYVMVETRAYLTANMLVEDYVFIGPGVVTTNDLRMLWQRAGAGAHLEGPTLRWGCRIGGGSVLLPGVEIGRQAVVGAGSVVVKSVPERAVVAGNPARVLRVLGPDEEPLLSSE